jgi:hypothetical protein
MIPFVWHTQINAIPKIEVKKTNRNKVVLKMAAPIVPPKRIQNLPLYVIRYLTTKRKGRYIADPNKTQHYIVFFST